MDQVRSHAAAHGRAHPVRGELEKYSEKSGATKPAFPCGFCGVRPSIGQIMIDPSDALGCPCSVVGSKAHPKPKHQCKLLGDVQYTLGAAAKCSLAAPCTNRPIKCVVCSMTVWSYSMAQHFEVKHTGMPLCALAIKPTTLTYHLLTLLCLGLQARRARQANQARLSREGACETAVEGKRVQACLKLKKLALQRRA